MIYSQTPKYPPQLPLTVKLNTTSQQYTLQVAPNVGPQKKRYKLETEVEGTRKREQRRVGRREKKGLHNRVSVTEFSTTKCMSTILEKK